ncbi:amidohydrolase [Muricoccus aerilatus]|uniref:amidohydrolase n=1 Tax=Muricoccus aerilatus TaxID=452982 RepID=UPI0005C23000|nr:amidohydrolase [Roseomonas aerilata]
MPTLARGCIAAALAAFLSIGTAAAQPADTVLLNGKVLTVDRDFSTREALAIRGGRVLATGSSEAMRALAGDATRVVDLGGRTVIPGLNDSHIHAIRAAQTFAVEVNWTGVPSLEEALARLREAAEHAPPEAWIIVAGGWMDIQFKEGRKPTQAEIVAAVPDHPVYIQQLYEWLLLSPLAMERLGIAREADLPRPGRLLLGPDGRPNGEIAGDALLLGALFNKLPRPSLDQEIEGTRRFFAEMNRLGVTGLIDPAGVSVPPSSYRPVMRLWQDGALTMRVSYHLSSQQPPGKELDDYRNLTQLLPSGFGDDMLRFGGIGEIVTWQTWTDNDPTEDAMGHLQSVLRWAARERMGLQIHWNPNRSAGWLLDLMEAVNRETPIADLRWWINHLHDATPETLRRMKNLGVAWSVQDSLFFSGNRFAAARGPEVSAHAPPIRTALEMGLHVAGGTDAHRVSSYNPFVALRWYLDGRTMDGRTVLGEAERITREQALRMYTIDSVWLARAEDRRGSLEPGKYADLAVLSADYATVPVQQIGDIVSELTMLGGRVVHATGPFAGLAAR